MANICIYCGSSPGNDPAFLKAAQAVGSQIAQGDHTLVYGGGDVGLMGAVADAVLAEGGKVIGVIPRHLADKEVAHHGLTELRLVDSMHERKQLMAELSDAFIALPGGVGTLEEVSEIFVWQQLGLHEKACALLNVNGFYEALDQFLDHMVSSGLLKVEHREQLLTLCQVETAVADTLMSEPSYIDKWIDHKK